MKSFITTSVFIAGFAFAGLAAAHGAKAQRGGVVQSAGDMSFELVAINGKAVIYVDDHGKPHSTRGASGMLTVLTGAKKSELALTPGGLNTLAGATPIALARGSKAIAAISLPGKEPLNVRFLQK